MTLGRSRPSAGGTVPTLFALLGTTGSAARGTTTALAAVSAAALALFGTSIAPVAAGPTGPSTTKVRVLSGRPDMVTGADVLIAAPDGTKFTVDGERVEATEVRPDQWLVDGLEPGRRVVAATSASGTTKLRIRVFPITGPVFSGPHLPLLACSTQSAGLGPPTDSDCSAPTTVTYQYWSSAGGFVPLPDGGAIPADAATTTVAGRTVPYVVRTETGVINRSVYWISILDPSPGADAFDVTGWNGRLVYRYGGGCGQSYGQGSPLAVSTMADGLLRAGYAVTTATFNTFQVQCNDVLSAETTMMVKEHFAEMYGPPEFTIGDGGSGGAIQQLAIAQNYPGLLDAIAPTVPFPDAITIAPGVADCGLLANYFATGDGSTLTQDQRTAISGYQTWASCELWNASFLGGIRPSDGCDPAIPPDRIYDAKANPEGIRCDLADANANQLGVDPVTGFANRPLDNVGVQYGLAALSSGAITPEQFLDLNAAIGGYDVDGGFVAERTVASPKTVRRAYELGRVLQGDDAQRALPIITTNFYTDSAGDIHTRVRLFTIRDRLADGGAVDRNHVIWTRPSTGSLVQTLTGAIGDSAALTGLLDQWVTTGERPSEAVDTCIAADGGTLAEGPDLHAVEQACNQTYPVFGDPRIAAGAPVGNDIVKCRRTEPGATDYAVQFTHTERARLTEVFPDGVCDWSSPGVGQVDKVGTWIDYTDPSAPIARGRP